MFPSLFPAVWYEKSLSVRCIPWNTGCGFHTHPTHWERRWRNTVCHYGWSALHCILFSPLQCLFPFPANKQAGQEKKAVQSPVVENLARKMIACQKKKTRGEYGVSVLRFFARGKAHGRNNKVPVPVRWYSHLCRVQNHTIGYVLYLPWTMLPFLPLVVTYTTGLCPIVWRVKILNCADNPLFWFVSLSVYP